MGCGPSSYPVVIETAEGDSKEDASFKENRASEKHVPSQSLLENLDANTELKQTEETKVLGQKNQDKTKDKGKVSTTRHGTSDINKVNSTNLQVFQNDSWNSSDQIKGNVMQVGDVADIQNESGYLDSHKDEGGIKHSLETTVPDKSESDIQGTAYLTSNQEIIESEKGINSEKAVEKDAQIENKMATPAEAEDRVIVQNECPDSATIADEEGVNDSTSVAEGHIPIINKTETVIHLPVKLSIGDLNEKENCNIENHDERHNDQEITTCITTEVISDEPSSPETMPQMSARNSDVNGESVSQNCPSIISNQSLLEEGKPPVAQNQEDNSHTNNVALSPAVNNQSNNSSAVEKMHNEIVLEQTAIQNALEKESEKSLHEHENTISVITVPESQHKLRNEGTSEELLGIDMQNMNPETAFNCPVKIQAADLIAVNAENTAVSSGLGDQEKREAILTPLEDSDVDVVTAQNGECANLDPTNSDMPCEEEVSQSRDINAENMLIAALRFSCKLSPGNPVKDLDIKGVMSLHLMRSLSPGEITVADLVWKLDNLTELDLSGNLLGPQGFRVICLALRRNTSIKMLNLANNLADTDCSECIGMMLSTNVYLEKLDVSGNNLGNDYFSRCVGPALMTNKSLKALRFSSCGSTDVSSICEAIAEGNTSLQELDASNNHFGAAAFGGGLSDILQKPGCCLRLLDVHGTRLEKEGMTALLEGMQHNSSLVSLNAAGNEVASLSFLMDFLYSCICHPTLEELIFERTKVLELDEWQPPDAPAPEGSSNITKLLLSGCSLTNKALQTLTAKVPRKLHALINLDLSNNNQLTADCLSSIATMISLEGQSSLSTLDFSLNVSDGIALEMEQLPELKNVKTLLLKKCRINPLSVVELSKFIATATSSFPQISSLTLDGIKLSGTGTLNGMLGLSDTFIPTNPCGLELLSLTGCVLNDRDVKPLLTALGNGLVVKELKLSANRLTDKTVNYLVDSGGTSLSLRALDLSINKIRDGGAEKLSQALSDKLKNLKTLSLADNDIGKTGILGLVGKICPASQLAVLNLKSQRQPVGEEDMDEIMEQLARTLGFDPESDEGNTFAYCDFPPNLSVNLTGLGGEPGELGPKLDSLAILTDYSSKHRRTLTLEDALQLSAVLSHADNARVQMSQRDWNLVISADKDAPAWLQLGSQRESAIYVSNLPLSVTAEKLEGLLDSEAECNVKEVYLLKDQILRKPNGLAWVLFSDTASVQRAVEYYNSGHAFMYGTPFVISTVNVDVAAEGGTEQNVETKARQEMIQRAEDRKADQTARAQLVQSNYQDSLARHEYAAQHPAYADGRVW